MRSHLSVCVASAILFSFILQSPMLVASPPPVPPGACLYALDSKADRAFQIVGTQSVYIARGDVTESGASNGFEMESSETLYFENHALVSVVGGAQLNGQTYLYDTISDKDASAVQTTNPGDLLSSLSPHTSGTIVGNSPTYYDINSKPANNSGNVALIWIIPPSSAGRVSSPGPYTAPSSVKAQQTVTATDISQAGNSEIAADDVRARRIL